jgi:hypothetical protein
MMLLGMGLGLLLFVGLMVLVVIWLTKSQGGSSN